MHLKWEEVQGRQVEPFAGGPEDAIQVVGHKLAGIGGLVDENREVSVVNPQVLRPRQIHPRVPVHDPVFGFASPCLPTGLQLGWCVQGSCKHGIDVSRNLRRPVEIGPQDLPTPIVTHDCSSLALI